MRRQKPPYISNFMAQQHRLMGLDPHTVWLDNFSKIYGCRFPNIDKGAWTNCLWTGIALHKYLGATRVTMDIIRDANGNDVPAMPDNVFAMVAMLQEVWMAYKATLDYRRHSLVSKWKVSCVPLKPQAENMPEGIWKQAIEQDVNTLRPLYPKAILPINIGSNLGLARIMRSHYIDNHQDVVETRRDPRPCGKYTAFNADIDIFRRTLKVNSTESREYK